MQLTTKSVCYIIILYLLRIYVILNFNEEKKGIEIDPAPLDVLFGNVPATWERNPHHHNTWRRERMATIPELLTLTWNSTGLITDETETVGVLDGYELRRIKTVEEQVAKKALLNWTVTDYTVDVRGLLPRRGVPKKYGYDTERRLSISLGLLNSPPEFQPVNGMWYWTGVDSDISTASSHLNFDISYGVNDTNESRLFVENEVIATRLTQALTRLGELQRAS